MRILLIGTDDSVFDEQSPLWRRHTAFAQGHRVDLVVLKKGASQTKHTSYGTLSMPGGSNKAVAFVHTLVEVCALTRKYRYDVVSTQDVLFAGVLGYCAARVAGVPFVVQLHGDYLDNPQWYASGVGTGNRLMNPVGKFLLRRADGVRAVSMRIVRDVVGKFDVPAERVVSIPIGANTAVFRVGTAPRGTTLLFVGRLLPEKDPMLFLEIALEVMSRKPETTVAFAGDGPLRMELEDRVRVAGKERACRFLGNCTQAELGDVYRDAQLLVHTAGWEGWGMPMIEAMACGCVVVTNDTGCAGEAVRDGETGVVVKGTKESFVEAIVELLATSGRLSALQQAGVREAEEWSESSLILKHVAFLEKIIHAKRPQH